MKKDTISFGIVLIMMMCVSFYVGLKTSPENQTIAEKNVKIKQLEEVIIEQQLMYTNMLKQMPQFKIKNWAMNR